MIQSSIEDHAAGLVRYYAAYHGTVYDAEDPEKLHRVRVTVPGLVEPSDWAWPVTAGGGSPQRGGHVAPERGADVLVWFVGGDPERPVYAGGWWGKPDAGTEALSDVDELSVADAPRVQSLELGRLKVTVDEREGNRALRLQDKVTGDFVTFDLESHALHVRMTTAVLFDVVGTFTVNALQIILNDRPVLPESKAI